MKKILSAILVAVMMLTVLASCATGGSGDTTTTSGTNTAVKLSFKVGSEELYALDVTVNGDAPVIIDAVKTAIDTLSVDIALSEGGDKVAHADSYKDCTLNIEGKDILYYWECTLNGDVESKLEEEPIKEGDEIVFIFTRGYMDENDDYQSAPYDPSLNEYYDPASTTAAE